MMKKLKEQWIRKGEIRPFRWPRESTDAAPTKKKKVPKIKQRACDYIQPDFQRPTDPTSQLRKCMNSNILNRALGTFSGEAFSRAEAAREVLAIHLAPAVSFDGSGSTSKASNGSGGAGPKVAAHKAGVNSITIDRFDGRLLLSGGADGSLHLWDLDSPSSSSVSEDVVLSYKPSQSLLGTQKTHRFGITHVSFYASDNGAFLTSSYDKSLAIHNTERLQTITSFPFNAVVYNHAMSPIASHCLVACATQYPAVRLVDLKSGVATQSLVGGKGVVLGVAWSPSEEHALTSVHSDGTARIWDVRRTRGVVRMLDKEDAIGYGAGNSSTEKKAHESAANGVVYTHDGRHVVTVGHDQQMRVWDTQSGANTLAAFKLLHNKHLSNLTPLIVPPEATVASGRTTVFYPNPKNLILFDLFEGYMLKQVSVPKAPTTQPAAAAAAAAAGGQMGAANSTKMGAVSGENNRTTRMMAALAWRAGSVEVYSAHSDGAIRAWKPRTSEDADVEDDAANEGAAVAKTKRKRKRDVLDEVYKSLTEQPITFN